MAQKGKELTRLPTKQKDGRYHYIWQQEGRQRHVAGATQMECITAYYKKSADIEAGVVDISAKTPVKVWAKQWFTTYKVPKGLTDKSLGMYREKLKNYILPAIGNKSLKSITELNLQMILNDSAGMSLSHCTKLRLVMREMFGKAYDLGYIHRNPAAGLELPAMSCNERRSLTPLEQDAFDQIIKEGTHRGCLFYQMVLYCGLRPGECAGLRWKHIDFAAGRVEVAQSKESGNSNIKEPKTDSGIRIVPIRKDYLKKLKAIRGLPDMPVFTRQNGTAHTDSSMFAMWRSWKREMDRRMAIITVQKAHEAKTLNEATNIVAGLSGDFNAYQLAKLIRSEQYETAEKIVTYRNQLILHGESEKLLDTLVAYDLRHTCCTNWLKAGINLKTVSYLMGHADIQTTANIYSHVDGVLINDASKKINNYADLA
jgi:integrase